MVGGGSRRDDGGLKIRSTNVFAALETLKKKKKSDKESKSTGSSKIQSKEQEQQHKQQVFWAPTPLTAVSWADVDDDDDYYATTAPPQPVWGLVEQKRSKETAAVAEEGSDTEDDGIDEGDDDIDEEIEPEQEHPAATGSVTTEPVPFSATAKETDRQLSKKELKKKEMAELEAVLAELGISYDDSNAVEDETTDKAPLEQSVDGDKVENAPESKTSKKKKAKKDKISKDIKEPPQPDGPNTEKSADEVYAEPGEEGGSAADVKEKIKVASVKKKKSTKSMDAAARAATAEAAARSAKLAAAKKKEKNHYNQQPVSL